MVGRISQLNVPLFLSHTHTQLHSFSLFNHIRLSSTHCWMRFTLLYSLRENHLSCNLMHEGSIQEHFVTNHCLLLFHADELTLALSEQEAVLMLQ